VATRLGRDKDEALAVILVDDEINKEILVSLENIKAAKSVCFVTI